MAKRFKANRRHLFSIFIKIIQNKAFISFYEQLTSLQRLFYVLQYAIAFAYSIKCSFWFSLLKLVWEESWTDTQLCFKTVKYSQSYQNSKTTKKSSYAKSTIPSKYFIYRRNIFMIMKPTFHYIPKHHWILHIAGCSQPPLQLVCPSTLCRIPSVLLLGMQEHKRNSVGNRIWWVLVLLCSKKPLKEARSRNICM